MKKARIEEVEPQLAQKLDAPWKDILQELSFPVPDNGYRLRVSLHSAKRRKKPSNAAAENWSPTSSDRAEIWFEPAPQQPKTLIPANPRIAERTSNPKRQETSGGGPAQTAYVHSAEADLLKALDRAESKPGWSFVSLKKFRDEVLPSEPVAANASKLTDVEWQSVLRSAIEKRFILVGKVPNPKSPQFPVTTIRLNRLMPEVRAVLGGGDDGADLEFQPVEIKGEPLSATIIRERHR
jgi:hypothetical protein